MTSPPGGGSVTWPQRASSGAARRMDALILAHSVGFRSAGRRSLACTSREFWPTHSIDAPTERISSTRVSMSRMRGTFCRWTGC